MELDFLITELDETTIQIDKMRYLTTQISTKTGRHSDRASHRDIFICTGWRLLCTKRC